MSMWMLCVSVRGLELREAKSQESKSGGVCAVLLDATSSFNKAKEN